MKQVKEITSGFILPIVLIIAGIVSTLLAYDLNRFVQQNKLHTLELAKQKMLLLMESESHFFLETLNHDFQLNNCHFLEICFEDQLHEAEISLHHQLFEIDVQFKSCAHSEQKSNSEINKNNQNNRNNSFNNMHNNNQNTMTECFDANSNVIGIFEISGSVRDTNSETQQWHWQRYAYIDIAEQEDAVRLRRSVLVAGL